MKKYLLLSCLLFSTWIVNAQLNLTQVGYKSYTGSVAGVWHYVDTQGNEYALVGADDRVSIVDVTTPSNLVEVFSVPANSGQSSLWRELKTYGNYAYAVSEGGGGVIIINLSYLPDSIQSKHWYGDGPCAGQVNSAHTIAATDGYIYIFGSNYANQGAIIADLTDPWNPTYAGLYDQNYVHDGYVRNDTMYTGEIYAGVFGVVDVTNKANPVLLATQPTPGAFCHNTWLSDNGQYLFTTDEHNNDPLGVFDISNLQNIKSVYNYFTDSMPTEEVHNVRVLNDYLINPSYGSQITVCDAARPQNIVEIGNYPTGTFLNWDADPYLPSGRIISTDTYGGLFVFEPTYLRACYLEGIITDSVTTLPLFNAKIEVINTPKTVNSKLTGEYKTGILTAGTFDVKVSRPGYYAKTITGVSFNNGVLTQLDVALSPFIFEGTVTNAVGGAAIANASVHASGVNGSETALTDINGNYRFTSLTDGVYEISISQWGFLTQCSSILVDGTSPLDFQLAAGYYDDFVSDNNWTVSTTATTGGWVRDIPLGTIYTPFLANPDVDANDDCSNYCFVTGNLPGNSNTDDVDNGSTVLTSPIFDLTQFNDPYIHYERWFFIQPNVIAASADTLFIYLSNGITTAQVDYVTLGSPGSSTWYNNAVRVANFFPPGPNMQLIISISDKPGSGNILEAGFDKFNISNGPLGIKEPSSSTNFEAYPNPFNNALTIKIPADQALENMEVMVHDLSGRLLIQGTITSYSSELKGSQDLNPGVYLITLIANGKSGIPLKVVKSN